MRDNTRLDISSLIDRACDGSQDLATVLRRCAALGYSLGSTELTDWATAELRGWADDARLPEYRYLRTELCASGLLRPCYQVQGAKLTRSLVPERLQAAGAPDRTTPETRGIPYLESLAANDGERVSYEWSAQMVREWKAESPEATRWAEVFSIWEETNLHEVRQLINEVRTRLIGFLSSLDQQLFVSNDPAAVNSKVRIQLFGDVGDGANLAINVGTGTATAGLTASGLITVLHALGLTVEQTAELRDSVVSDRKQGGSAWPGPLVRKWLDRLKGLPLEMSSAVLSDLIISAFR